MTALEIELVPCLRDNYAYLVRDANEGICAIVDPSEAAPVRAALDSRGWRLTHILNTHHHWDHTGGNAELKEAYGATVIGPEKDRARIPAIDVGVEEGSPFMLGSHRARVLEIPAHTRAHIAFAFEDDSAVFTGDTLFAMGCGRLFEGTPEMMWRSLSKLTHLSESMRVYCGHEYTQSNARFALTVEPDNAALAARSRRVDALRAEGKSTVPGTMAEEIATNPFLRADQPALQAMAGAPGDPVATFAAIRRRKDSF